MDLLKLLQMYFPKELPPTFTTKNYALALSVATNPFTDKPKSAKLMKHEIPRHNLNRRVMGIPNPVFHYNLCTEIASNWGEIEPIYQQSRISRSSPTFIATIPEDANNPILDKLNTRALSSYVLKADISRCFPSIYTHSIPWALHTKQAAKSNRSSSFLGNRIDTWVRKGQDEQTIGIPVGPYTSVVISEIILCAIDIALQNKISSLRGTRYVDDFELGFKSYSEAEKCLMELNFILRDFELEINQLKTEIVKLPIQLEAKWVQTLRNFELVGHSDSNTQKRKLLAYFDEVLTLLEANSQEHVLNYALSKLDSLELFPQNYKIIQDFLFQCLMIDTSAFWRVLNLLKRIHPYDESADIDTFDNTSLKELLHHQIVHNCNLKRAHEVAWALWAMMYWNLDIEDEAAKLLSQVDDSIVALMTLHAKRLRLISCKLDTGLWEIHLNEEGLYGPQWLLAYEAKTRGWLARTKPDYITNDHNFGFLKKHNVKFYDTRRDTAFDLSEIVRLNVARGGNYDSEEDAIKNYIDYQLEKEDDIPF